MKTLLMCALGLRLIFLTGCTTQGQQDDQAQTHEATPMTTSDYKTVEFNTITGEPASLNDFAGKVVLVVNTASKCGFTKQYAGLEELYRDKKDQGLVVIGFPANNFGNQEPGNNEEILSFCQTNFDVTFPMMAKISVKGDDQHPLYAYFTKDSPFPGDIGWNFTKFLIDREGNVTARYESSVAPDNPELTAKIDELL